MNSDWVKIERPNNKSVLRVICLPYAGGSANIFSKWDEFLPKEIELLAIELPGRARRLFETPISNMDVLIPTLANELKPYLDKPYILLGHSLGARICFELMNYFISFNMNLPCRYIASGSKAPHLFRSSKKIAHLCDDDFIKELEMLGGTPAEILENREMMELLIPMIRADFNLVDTYHPPKREKLSVPITIFNGINDYPDEETHRSNWQMHFKSVVDYFSFSGGHFFINEQRSLYLNTLNECVNYELNELCFDVEYS